MNVAYTSSPLAPGRGDPSLDQVGGDAAAALLARMDALEHRRSKLRSAYARRKRRRLALTAVALMGVGAYALSASSACQSVLPTPLTTFCAGEPLKPTPFHGNFQVIMSWLEKNKVGPLANPNVSTPSLDAVSLSAADLTVGDELKTQTLNANTSIVINDTAKKSKANAINSPKITVKSMEGSSIKFAGDKNENSNIEFEAKWTLFGATNSEGQVDGTSSFWISADGRPFYPGLNAAGTSKSAILMLPADFCVAAAFTGTCPDKWTSKTIRWDTEDDNNGDSVPTVMAASGLSMRFCCRGSAW